MNPSNVAGLATESSAIRDAEPIPVAPPPARSTRPSWFEATSIVMVVIIVAVYLYLIRILMGGIEANDLAWTRQVFLLQGVEALALAAVGYMFGQLPSRSVVKAARQETVEAKQESHQARRAAHEASSRSQSAQAQLRALVSGIMALDEREAGQEAALTKGIAPSGAGLDAQVRALRTQVRLLGLEDDEAS